MDTREVVKLTKEQETLLIPLYAKSQANPFFADEKAGKILEQLQYDFRQLNVPKKTAVTLCIRAKQLDTYTQDFINAHPNALILHLGCGLDSRCMRVKHANTLWFDLDFPDVIALRSKFYPETGHYHMIASSVTDLGWIDQVPDEGRPVMIVAEGLFMYLHESELRSLLLCLQQKFPGAHLVFDAFSQMTARRIQGHPSLQKTGASVHWGIDDPHEMETWGKGIRLKEEWFFSQSPDLKKLDWFYRVMFRLTGSIMTVQRAQRLLYFTF